MTDLLHYELGVKDVVSIQDFGLKGKHHIYEITFNNNSTLYVGSENWTVKSTH